MTIVERYHELILNEINKDKAIDATCGNGHDTLFLATLYKEVIGLDIQDLAIKRTKEKTKDICNIHIYKDDFNNIAKYGNANLICFNLGFLPGSNKKIKTQDYTSSNAVLEAYKICSDLLICACYTKHEGGIEEYNNLINCLKENNIDYSLEEFESEDKLIIIKKNGTF